MDKSSKRGRPATGHVYVGIRFPPALLERVMTWGAANDLERSTAIRQLIEAGLQSTAADDKGG